MRNPESVLENETHKLLWYFEIQTDHLISIRRLDLIITNKKRDNLQNCGLYCPADHRVKLKQCEKRDKYLDLVEHKSDDYTNCNWCSGYSHQRIGTRTGGLGNKGTDTDCLNCSIVEIARILRRFLET